mgnify:CR=1 FL=1
MKQENKNKQTYEFKPKDFIPIYGVIRYAMRNDLINPEVEEKINIRGYGLTMYNLALVIASFIGLEKLIR